GDYRGGEGSIFKPEHFVAAALYGRSALWPQRFMAAALQS
ncbi:MAG: hypothetical protein ACI9HA_002538, partial [Dinoroseobacter sp.]